MEHRHFIKRGMPSSAMSDSSSSPRLQAPLCHGLRNTRGFSLVFLQPSSSPQQRCEDLSHLPHVHSPPLWCFQGGNDGGLTFPTKFLQTPLGLSNPAAKSSLHAHTMCKCLSALLRDPGDSHMQRQYYQIFQGVCKRSLPYNITQICILKGFHLAI